MSQLGGVERGLLPSGGWRPGMLLKTLQGTGQPPLQRITQLSGGFAPRLGNMGLGARQTQM